MFTSRLTRTLGIGVTGLVLLIAGAGSAEGAELDLGRTCDKYMSCSFVLYYTGAPGERNDVHVTRREQTLIVTDPGAMIATRTGTCVGHGHDRLDTR